MYDDLERSQRPSHLEWLVVNMVVPSLLVSLVLQGRSSLAADAPPLEPGVFCNFAVIGVDHALKGLIPDVFPKLLRMPVPTFPRGLDRALVTPRVYLRGLVDTHGRVQPGSIDVVQLPADELEAPARRALAGAVFRPAQHAGHPVAAWITIAVNFHVRGE